MCNTIKEVVVKVEVVVGFSRKLRNVMKCVIQLKRWW